MNESLKELLDTVVNNDYCIGCGICASLNESPLSMKLNNDGKFQPILIENSSFENFGDNFLSVCPFSNNSKNETQIGEEVFGSLKDIKFNEYTGYYISNYAGYVKEGEFRTKGSSGGMGTWIVNQLLKENLVDGIIHVKNSDQNNNLLFEYQISYSEDQLFNGAKSKYYPIEMSQVIKFVKENAGRYAIIGIPCYIKAIRLLAEQDIVVKERVKYFIGLVCGHLKSELFAKSIGWEMGIKPEELKGIDFRKKLMDRAASNYGVEAVGRNGENEVVACQPTKDLYTTNWGYGFFKYNACEFCDDVLGETADVTVGDAWLPEYTKDSLGTNIIVVRNPVIQQIIEKNKEKIQIEEISTDKVYQSQAGGFRHRREGLSYRLYLKDLNGDWRPNKRVKPKGNHINKRRRKIYEKRFELSMKSFEAYKLALLSDDFNSFISYMNPLIKDYDKVATPTIVTRVIRKIGRGIYTLISTK
jgi:coenzyme F420 hydrogenase subunit beta